MTLFFGHRLYVISTSSNSYLWACPTLTPLAPEKEKYGQSPQELPQFEMKCEPNKFNHVVIQNTVTTHTWAIVIIFQWTISTILYTLWYCSVSGVNNRINYIFKIQNKIYFRSQVQDEAWRRTKQKQGMNTFKALTVVNPVYIQYSIAIEHLTGTKHQIKWNVQKILPSFSICIFAPLNFQRTVGGGELVTSQTMLALSPSVNSWGEGAFVKVIFSGT